MIDGIRALKKSAQSPNRPMLRAARMTGFGATPKRRSVDTTFNRIIERTFAHY